MDHLTLLCDYMRKLRDENYIISKNSKKADEQLVSRAKAELLETLLQEAANIRSISVSNRVTCDSSTARI